MDRNRLWSSVKERLPFRVAQRILSATGFPKGKSWTAIEDKITDGEQGGSYSALETAYIESLVVSEKSVSLYELSDDQMQAAYKACAAIEKSIPDSPFKVLFPYSLTETELSSVSTTYPTVVASVEYQKATSIIYAYPRIIETRVELPTSALALDSGQFSSVIAIERKVVQAFSAIVLPHFGNIIEVYVDDPVGSSSKIIDIEHLSMAIAFNNAVGASLLKGRVNLYSAIGGLYASEEGMVTHLGHTVATSVKHEKMRGAGRCVRRELFHAGGVEAVHGEITPFSIEVVWGNEDESMTASNPSVSIDGTYMMTYQASPNIDIATLRKCATYEDASFVIGKVLAHLSKADA